MAKATQRTSRGGGMNIQMDLEEVCEFIGIGRAMAKSPSDKEYLNNLMDSAFREAEDEFNLMAAAKASAGGNIKHMFEWGTLGINRGRTNRRPAPTSENARLWITRFSGRGLKKTIHYDFKPSTAQVPLPTKRDTGIDVKHLSQLERKHVFKQKAFMFEMGAVVTIRPKSAKALFIPTKSSPKGFIFSRNPVQVSIGQRSQGQFTAFVEYFWSGPGELIVQERIDSSLQKDFVNEMDDAHGSRLLPAGDNQKLEARIKQKENQAMRTAVMKSRSRAK